MKSRFCTLAVAALVFSLLSPTSGAEDPLASVVKRGGHTVSLDLKFSRKNQNPLQSVIAFLDYGPNGHATGFIVGDGLVMTAHHVVSGELSASKKVQLGFGSKEELRVKVFVNGCQATVIKVDEDADLALLRACRSQKQITVPAFQSTLIQDEKLLLIARPHGDKLVRRGVFQGPYLSRGLQYWSAKIDVRDGYSGSPVYNNRAELIGVFTGYDWSRKLALISPGDRAQKLIDDYAGGPNP